MGEGIVFFGASSTWGAWDRDKGGWVNRIRLFLDNKDSDFFVYNQGVSGHTSEDLLARFEIELKARDPEIVVISIGDNDSVVESPDSKNWVVMDKYGENIKKLIEISKKYTGKILFLSLKKVDESKTMPVSWGSYYYSNSIISKYNNKLKDICNLEKVEFLDILELLSENDFEDGLHPNSKGHEKIAKKVMEKLAEKRWVF